MAKRAAVTVTVAQVRSALKAAGVAYRYVYRGRYGDGIDPVIVIVNTERFGAAVQALEGRHFLVQYPAYSTLHVS